MQVRWVVGGSWELRLWPYIYVPGTTYTSLTLHIRPWDYIYVYRAHLVLSFILLPLLPTVLLLGGRVAVTRR